MPTWKLKDQFVEKRKKSVSSIGRIAPGELFTDEEFKDIVLENEVMRSLFDTELCVVCKYQRILYKDFIL